MIEEVTSGVQIDRSRLKYGDFKTLRKLQDNSPEQLDFLDDLLTRATGVPVEDLSLEDYARLMREFGEYLREALNPAAGLSAAPSLPGSDAAASDTTAI
jgi:hypothetical protein